MIPIDFLVIFGLVAIFSAYSFYFGKNRAVGLLMSAYLALIFFEKAPFIEKLIIFKSDLFEIALNKLVIFITFTILLNVLIHRHINSMQSELNFIRSVAFGLAITLFILIVYYFVIPMEVIHNFTERVDNVFLTHLGAFYWLLVPFALIFFA